MEYMIKVIQTLAYCCSLSFRSRLEAWQIFIKVINAPNPLTAMTG